MRLGSPSARIRRRYRGPRRNFDPSASLRAKRAGEQPTFPELADLNQTRVRTPQFARTGLKDGQGHLGCCAACHVCASAKLRAVWDGKPVFVPAIAQSPRSPTLFLQEEPKKNDPIAVGKWSGRLRPPSLMNVPHSATRISPHGIIFMGGKSSPVMTATKKKKKKTTLVVRHHRAEKTHKELPPTNYRTPTGERS